MPQPVVSYLHSEPTHYYHTESTANTCNEPKQCLIVVGFVYITSSHITQRTPTSTAYFLAATALKARDLKIPVYSTEDGISHSLSNLGAYRLIFMSIGLLCIRLICFT